MNTHVHLLCIQRTLKQREEGKKSHSAERDGRGGETIATRRYIIIIIRMEIIAQGDATCFVSASARTHVVISSFFPYVGIGIISIFNVKKIIHHIIITTMHTCAIIYTRNLKKNKPL